MRQDDVLQYFEIVWAIKLVVLSFGSRMWPRLSNGQELCFQTRRHVGVVIAWMREYFYLVNLI